MCKKDTANSLYTPKKANEFFDDLKQKYQSYYYEVLNYYNKTEENARLERRYLRYNCSYGAVLLSSLLMLIFLVCAVLKVEPLRIYIICTIVFGIVSLVLIIVIKYLRNKYMQRTKYEKDIRFFSWLVAITDKESEIKEKDQQFNIEMYICYLICHKGSPLLKSVVRILSFFFTAWMVYVLRDMPIISIMTFLVVLALNIFLNLSWDLFKDKLSEDYYFESFKNDFIFNKLIISRKKIRKVINHTPKQNKNERPYILIIYDSYNQESNNR